MKRTYASTKQKQALKLQELINTAEGELIEIGNFGPIGPDFHEKYRDPYFDKFRETEADYEISNSELLESFEVAYGYLLHLRYWVGIEQDYINGTL